jgi:flagellar biosynthesis component FlhA
MNQTNLTRTLWISIAVIVSVPILFLGFVYRYQGLTGVQQWLIPISGFVSLITISIGSLLGIYNYRLNVQAEKRLNDSTTIESNIRLLTLFSKMMQISNSRSEPVLSEKVIEGLFQNKLVTENDFKDEASFQKLYKKLQLSVIPPYGLATQKASIGAVYTLGKEHSILRYAAIEGLKEVKDMFIQAKLDYEFITKFIDDLERQPNQD